MQRIVDRPMMRSMATESKRKRSEIYDDDEDHSYSDDDDMCEISSTNEPNPPGMTDSDSSRRDERLKKNRQKARDRRNRKKVMIEEMQRNVVVLSRMNSELRKNNQGIMQKLSRFGAAGISSCAGQGGQHVRSVRKGA